MKEFLLDLKVSFRNRIDYFRYGHKIGYINLWTIFIDLLLLLYTILDYQTLAQADNLVVLLFLIFTIVWQAVGFFMDFHHYTRRTDDYFNLHTAMDGAVLKINDRIKAIYDAEPHDFGETRLIFSTQINAVLQSDVPIRVLLSPGKEKKVTRYIRTYRDLLLPFLNGKWHQMRHGSFYNERKLCMASEFTESKGAYNVLVCRGNYYNSYLTNFIYAKKLSHQSGWKILPPVNSSNYPIGRLEDSFMSNHIGISTLALTADGYVILLCHNNKALTATDQLTPSGSGSVDFRDLRADADFRATLLAAAERELCEETNIAAVRIEKTSITGFYRDLGRGGKPEFCCVTYLKDDYLAISELEPNCEEQQDEPKKFRILDADGQLNGPDLPAFEEMILHPGSSENQPSLALYMCFVMLRLYYERRVPDKL